MKKTVCMLVLLFFVAACGTTVNPVPTVTATLGFTSTPSATPTEQNIATATSTVTPSPSSTTSRTPTYTHYPTTSPTPTTAVPAPTATVNTFDAFVKECERAGVADVSCMYVEGVLALNLERLDGLIFPKQEGMAKIWNEAWNEGQVVGILAHNSSEGQKFYQLVVDQIIYLIWTNGKIEGYRINEKAMWRNDDDGKLLLFSPWNGGLEVSDEDLINLYYRRGNDFNKMVLQTCISNTEGLFFVVANRIPSRLTKSANNPR